MFNPAISRLTAPPVSVVQDWRASYDGARGQLIDMSQAVPGYAAHPDMTAALESAAANPDSARYGRVEGDLDLREAYAAHLDALYGASVTAAEIHITSGCNQAFVASILAVAGHGDEILMTRPCYFNHESTLGMLGVGIGYVDCHAENGMLPTPADIDASIGPNTRALAIVSPNNPCGSIYPAGLLTDIFTLCRDRGIWLILDETYRDFLPVPDISPHDLLATDGWQDTLVQLYSFSKSYCMPGHRLGAVTAGSGFVFELAKIIDNIQICAPRAPQMAVTPMLKDLAGWREENRQRIAARSAIFGEVMSGLDGWELLSTGAYFGYVRHPFAGEASLDVAKRMARESGVLTIPGTFFGDGQEDFLRFAFANAGRDVIAALPDRLSAL
ncbi:MAG: aminotransferase [Pseudomonadota bacterium]|nr:aminotransferase [Pseudomonadota bacterium]MEC8673695.1 aminotransferase [Pseudomonadota bacterium]